MRIQPLFPPTQHLQIGYIGTRTPTLHPPPQKKKNPWSPEQAVLWHMGCLAALAASGLSHVRLGEGCAHRQACFLWFCFSFGCLQALNVWPCFPRQTGLAKCLGSCQDLTMTLAVLQKSLSPHFYYTFIEEWHMSFCLPTFLSSQ